MNSPLKNPDGGAPDSDPLDIGGHLMLSRPEADEIERLFSYLHRAMAGKEGEGL